MENQDKVQDVLSNFVKTPSKDIPPLLEDYLRSVAKTGKTVFPWLQLKTLFVQKLEQVMEQFVKEDPCEHQLPFPNVDNTKYEEMRRRIIDALQRFTGAPFTVQRICELVTQPKKHYTQCDKFLRGIEKNVMVVSTVDPSGSKIVSESRAMVNGLDLNGVDGQRDDFNDITDEQPFGSGPHVDWSGDVATVWPVNLASENQSNSNNSAADDCKPDSINDDEKTTEETLETSESQIKKLKTSDSEHEESLVVTDCVVKDSIPKISSQSDAEPQSDENERKDLESSETSDQSQSIDSSTEKETESVTTECAEQVSDSIVSSENETDTKPEVVTTDEVKEITTGEKHLRDVNESSGDEPPEKKQKMESDGEEVKANTDVKADTDEVEEPAPVTQTDTHTDTDDVPECDRTSSETEQTCDQEEDKSSEDIQAEKSADKTNAPVDDKNATESSDTENSDTATQDQSDINKEADTTTNITDTQSTDVDTDSATDEQDKEHVSDNVTEETITGDGSKDVTDQDIGTDNVSSADTVEDSNSGTELMETDSVVKQDEGVTDVKDAVVDESEPMEHE